MTQRPQLFTAERTVDLGEVVEGDLTQVSWIIENRGNADLVIERTRSGCGCTVVQLEDADKVIRPDGTLELKAEFNSKGRSGQQKKIVRVFSNDPDQPMLELTFTAQVQMLFSMSPPALLNMRAVRRGEPASKTLDIFPGPGRKSVTVEAVEISELMPLKYAIEEVEVQGVSGKRIRFTVLESASLGMLVGQIKIRISVDGMERKRQISVRADVQGALTWTPRILDASRQILVSGRRLAPVTVRSTTKERFKILEATVGSTLDVVFSPEGGANKSSNFSLYLTVREDAAPGPFATTLEVRTDSLDLPWIGIPVFGIIAAPIDVDPPLVLLRDDGTQAGKRRPVKLKTAPSIDLEVTEASCDNPAVSVKIERVGGRRSRHRVLLTVELVGELPKGTHEAVIRVATGVRGHELLEIPVTIYAIKER